MEELGGMGQRLDLEIRSVPGKGVEASNPARQRIRLGSPEFCEVQTNPSVERWVLQADALDVLWSRIDR